MTQSWKFENGTDPGEGKFRVNNAENQMQQLPNGQWVPAQPLPFCRDTRPWYVRLWHAILECFGWDSDELLDSWYVPMEPPIEEDLNKIRG